MLTDFQDLLYEPQRLYAIRIATGFALVLILFIMTVAVFLAAAASTLPLSILVAASAAVTLYATWDMVRGLVGLMRRRQRDALE
jgi:hypothetical protein